MQNTILKTLLLAMLSVTTGAFVVTPSAKATTVRMEAAKQNEFIPSHVKAAAFAALVTVSQPLMALAEDDYEYGGTDKKNKDALDELFLDILKVGGFVFS